VPRDPVNRAGRSKIDRNPPINQSVGLIYRPWDRFLARFGGSLWDAGAEVTLSGVQELGEVCSCGRGDLGKESDTAFCNLVHVVLANRFPSCL
jgi:hypothetical protein